MFEIKHTETEKRKKQNGKFTDDLDKKWAERLSTESEFKRDKLEHVKEELKKIRKKEVAENPEKLSTKSKWGVETGDKASEKLEKCNEKEVEKKKGVLIEEKKVTVNRRKPAQLPDSLDKIDSVGKLVKTNDLRLAGLQQNLNVGKRRRRLEIWTDTKIAEGKDLGLK